MAREENPSLERFEPHVSATTASPEPWVWAVDTRHLPLFWFPRDCPVSNLWPIWDRVVASALEYSGIRLRNARPRGG